MWLNLSVMALCSKGSAPTKMGFVMLSSTMFGSCVFVMYLEYGMSCNLKKPPFTPFFVQVS